MTLPPMIPLPWRRHLPANIRRSAYCVSLSTEEARLGAFFHVAYCEKEFLRYLIRRGNHLDYFLDRSAVVDGKLVLAHRTEEEQSEETAAAIQAYFDDVRARLASAANAKAQGRPENR